MVNNLHREIYKKIKKNFKLGINLLINKDTNDYQLCLELVEFKYLTLLTENNYNATFIINDEVNMNRKKREKAYRSIIINKEKFPIKLSEKPIFGGKGRTWEKIYHVINDLETPMYLDTTWGNYIYFQSLDNRWYKIGSNSKYVFEDDYGYIGFNKLISEKNLNIKLHF